MARKLTHIIRRQNLFSLAAMAFLICRRSGASFLHFSGTKSNMIRSQVTKQAASSTTASLDCQYMRQALEQANKGLGGTYPNPAVGCVIVDGRNNVIGKGFHPKSGMPHAEVFALFEASGAVEDGTAAALSVVPGTPETEESRKVVDLLAKYASDGGARDLFDGCLSHNELFEGPITAYVTLEPCCHYGKTPPCAMTFVHAGVDKVVVGFRDPNPRVDGGGVRLLLDNGIDVDFIQGVEAKDCSTLVNFFVKRITSDPIDYDECMKGSHRSALRSLAGRRKSDGTIPQLSIASSDRDSSIVKQEDNEDIQEGLVKSIDLKPGWLEEADSKLWRDEILLLRLGGAVSKKKAAKILGERIASELEATVVQVLGHTVLLYRPGSPPVLDLEQMIEENKSV